MGSFGERMQREREMRSIALEEIAESTKISCRMLRALEEEDFDKLPGGIFNKGFVRAYAKFLGIDEEQAVLDYQAAFVEKQQKQATNGHNGMPATDVMATLAAAAERERKPEPDHAAGFMRAAVIIVCILGIGGLAWKYVWPRLTPASTQQQPSDAAPAQTPQKSTTPPAAQASSEPAVTVPLKVDAATKAPETTPAESAPAATEEAATPSGGTFRLRLHARETSWIEVTADGSVLMRGELSPSSTRSFQAAKEMVVVLGNAKGVDLSYNGKPLPQFAAEPRARKLTFNSEGLQQ